MENSNDLDTSTLSTSFAGDTAVSRRGLLGKAVITGLAAVPVVGLLSSKSEAAFQPLDASSREAFTDLQFHENEHVGFLERALGSKARPKPTFRNLRTKSFNDFVLLSRALENTGVGAYLGALPLIQNPDFVAAAGAIALIEARHAGWLNVFTGIDISTGLARKLPVSFEKPLTIAQVVNNAGPYISSLNGGPPASFTAGDDISILNFALLLEYLEAEYYNINVPRYFAKS